MSASFWSQFPPVLPGRRIAVEDTGNGYRVHYAGPDESAGLYRGYFQLRAEITGSLSRAAVIDGTLADAGAAAELPAGYAVINEQLLAPEAAWLPLNEGMNYVYLDFSLLEASGEIAVDYRCESLFPPPEELHLKWLLGTVELLESGRVRVCQQQHGAIYGSIFRHCREPLL